jgi:hypothetical protein
MFPMLLTFAACGSSGTLQLSLTDAPLDGATEVNVTIASIEAHQNGDWTTVLDEERSYNLLDLQGGVTADLGAADFPAGKITQIRLHLSDSTPPTVVDAAGTQELTIPSGYQSGIKLVGCFEVKDGETTDITLDFDAARSVQSGGGGLEMRPTIKIVESSSCKGDADSD